MKCLLSVDWDYFICTPKNNPGSYSESAKNIVNLWYKRYIQSKMEKRDIQRDYKLIPEIKTFWDNLSLHFKFTKDVKAYLSDSHAFSYDIARETDCNCVYLFDAHSDLGYGGLSSLNFEVNCANWLGMLLKDKKINEANIIYSPFTAEKPEYFKQINNSFAVRYPGFNELGTNIEVSAIHICRSGAWTPPWLDEELSKFLKASGITYQTIDCPERKWDPENINFSDVIYFMMA